MAIKNTPPPLSSPFVDDNGKITEKWLGWLKDITAMQKQRALSIPDGTYTLGLGTANGTITIQDGFIIDIQEVT